MWPFHVSAGLIVACLQFTDWPHILSSTDLMGTQMGRSRLWRVERVEPRQSEGGGPSQSTGVWVKCGKPAKVKVVVAHRQSQSPGAKGEVKFGTVSHREPLQVLKQGGWLVTAMLCDILGYPSESKILAAVWKLCVLCVYLEFLCRMPLFHDFSFSAFFSICSIQRTELGCFGSILLLEICWGAFSGMVTFV